MVISYFPDGNQISREEELMVATASDDGTVKLWQPLQVGSLHITNVT